MRSILPLLLTAAVLPASAEGPWDVQYTLNSRHQELEVAWLPFFVEVLPQNVFANLKASVSFVKPHEDYRKNGVRLHIDTEAGKGGGYFTTGVFLSGGENVGAGLGFRIGGGWKPSRAFRFGFIGEAVAGTSGSHGNLGVQGGWTF